MVVAYNITLFRMIVNISLDVLLIMNVVIMCSKWLSMRHDTTNKRNMIAFWIFSMSVLYMIGHICETCATWLYLSGIASSVNDILSVMFLLCFTLAYIPYSEFFHTMFNIDKYGRDIRMIYIVIMYLLVGSSVGVLFVSFSSPFAGIPSMLMISSGPLTMFSYIPLMILLYGKSLSAKTISIKIRMNMIGISGILFILSQIMFGLGGTVWYGDVYWSELGMNLTTMFFAMYILFNIFGWAMPRGARTSIDARYTEKKKPERQKKTRKKTVDRQSATSEHEDSNKEEVSDGN